MLIKMRWSGMLLVSLLACSPEEESETGQEHSLPPSTIQLASMEAFHTDQQSHWKTVGEVTSNRQQSQHVKTQEGNGILVYLPAEEGRTQENLPTQFEHGDMDLELDFLMSKNARSGILLQGRYEVQLADSWLKEELTYTDCGTISKGGKGDSQASLPSLNATKAPGLWQHLKIRFLAPVFDDTGKKTADAIFKEVYLNGKLIQENVAVSSPGTNAAFQDEQPTGPLILQGDQGPVAFRNIRYKSYGSDRIILQNMKYAIYEGLYEVPLDTLQYLQPTATGTTDSLSQNLSSEHDLLVIEGTMDVPKEGKYIFELESAGMGRLLIDDEVVADNGGSHDFAEGYYGSLQLTEGPHHFKILYTNYYGSLSVRYEGPGIPWTTLSTPASARFEDAPDAMPYLVGQAPKMQRGFMMHQGEKKEFVIAVGIPGGLNYAYDLKNYNLLGAWHGEFLNVGPMWISRGETQLAKPLGATIEFVDKPAVAKLQGNNASWPDSVNADHGILKNRGYKIMKSGLPMYFYSIHGVEVEDYLQPDAEKGLKREVNFRFPQDGPTLYFMLGAGSSVQKLSDGSYTIDHKNYYIDKIISSDQKPEIRKENGYEALVIPVYGNENNDASLSYTIIW